jgi:hypothetical protein
LSALVWLAHTKTEGFDLDHHNVFFSDDYHSEFRDIAAGKPPSTPTAYVCALKAISQRSDIPATQQNGTGGLCLAPGTVNFIRAPVSPVPTKNTLQK